MKSSVKIIYAGPGDASLIASVGRETFYETWRPVNTEEDMQEYMAKEFSEAGISQDLANPMYTFLLASVENKPVGYTKLRRDRSYDEFKGEKVIEIERIYVRKEFQGKKIGIAMMEECISIARNEGNSWLWLGVNIDNHKAISFYKLYGFTTFGTKHFQLGSAVDDDYLMKKDLREQN